MKLVHLSDIHFGSEDRAALAALAAFLAAEPADLLVVTGDITQAGRRREFAAAAQWLQSLPAPVVITPGNHDIPAFNPWQRFLSPFARFRAAAGPAHECFACGPVAVAALATPIAAQTRFDWSLGHVRRSALRRTLDCLQGMPACRWTLVACHHPLTDLPGDQTPGFTRRGAATLEKLAEQGVQLVLSGHTHAPFRRDEATAYGPIALVGAGTLSTRLRQHAASVNVLHFTPEHWTVETRLLD